MAGTRITRRRREGLLEQFDRSELSASEFARRHRVKVGTFYSWLRNRVAEPSGGSVGPEGFVEVEVDSGTPTADGGGELELRLPGGARTRVVSEGQAKMAAALLVALDGRGLPVPSRRGDRGC